MLQLLRKDPSLTAKPICQILAWNYENNKDYVDHLRARWKTDYRNGLGPKRPTFHRWQGSAYAPVKVDRASALGSGWVQSNNRNRAFLYKDRLGRLEWWETGKVRIWVRKPANDGKLYHLLSNAFFATRLIIEPRVLKAFVDSVQFVGAHAVFDVGERLPYARIEDFKESNGVIIKTGDLSDPTAIEIEFHRPKWDEQTQERIDALDETIQAFLNAFREPSRPGRLKPSSDRSVV